MIYIIGRGIIGSTLADYFADRGEDLVTIGRHDPWPEFRETDTIINCAASGYYSEGEDVVKTVKDNFLLPVQLHQKSNGANMIHFGSWFEEVNPHHDYSRSKALATSYLTGEAHICMLSNVWGGPFDNQKKFMPTLMKSCAYQWPMRIIQYGRRDYVHVDSFCVAVEELTKRRDYRKRYFATGRPRSFWEVYQTLCSIVGHEFPNVSLVDDGSITIDWPVTEPHFEDTFRDDLAREWKKLKETR